MTARRHGVVVALVLAIGALLVGCGTSNSALPRDLATQWQDQVAAIAQSASAGDTDAAAAALDTLLAEAKSARESGAITAERAALIAQAVEQVREDLAPTPSPTPAPEPQTPATTTVDPAPVTEDDDDNGNGDEDDKGKDGEKGKDNGKDKGKGKGAKK